MSPQHDMVIANGTGSAVRSDINGALAALVANSSGSTEPATTYAYMLWADSTANVMKMRNGANSGWIELFELDGEFGSKTFNGNITLNAQGDLRLADSDSSNWVAFQAPATVASNVTWTLPSADGTANQTLITNGSGTLSWATPTSTSDIITEGNTSAEVVDTGSDGHFKVVTEGTEAMRITAAQRVGIGTTSPTTDGTRVLHVAASSSGESALIRAAGNGSTGVDLISGGDSTAYLWNRANTSLLFGTNAVERAHIDSSGRLLVGTSSVRTVGWWDTPKVQIDGLGYQQASLLIYSNSNDIYPAVLALGKSRGAAIGSNTIVQNGDELGEITFYGSDGSNETRGAAIGAYVDNTPGANDMPTRLVFSTTADGASGPTERLRINSAGDFICPNIYDGTVANAANVFVASNGQLYRSTSSIKYKTDVETLENSYADALLGCRPVWYRSLNSGDNPEHGYYGFIAEEVAEIDPRLVHWKTTEITYDEKGSIVETPCDPEPEGVQYDRFVPHLLNLIKRQGEAIAELQAEVTALKAS